MKKSSTANWLPRGRYYVCSGCSYKVDSPFAVCPHCTRKMNERVTLVGRRTIVKKAVVTGYWLRRTHLFRPNEYICSAYGYTTVKRNLKVCPRCSASMKKTKYDPSWVDEAEFYDLF